MKYSRRLPYHGELFVRICLTYFREVNFGLAIILALLLNVFQCFLFYDFDISYSIHFI